MRGKKRAGLGPVQGGWIVPAGPSFTEREAPGAAGLPAWLAGPSGTLCTPAPKISLLDSCNFPPYGLHP